MPWVSAKTKTKSAIILCLGDSDRAKTHELVDGDGASKQLWNELERIYIISSN